MSLQSTKRANAIIKDFDALSKDAATAVSKLVDQTAKAKVLVAFLHDNLLNNKGDMSEGDRVDVRNALVPLYPQIKSALSEVEAMFGIHDSDVTVWQSNFDAYLIENPNVLEEALNRFPKVD